MRLIAVALLALTGLLGLAPAAHADAPAGYEAWLTRGCGSTLELVNGSTDEVVSVVTRSEAEPVEVVLAAGGSWRVELDDLEPDPTVAVGQEVVTPTQVVAECGGVAKIDARACDGEVDVTMAAVSRPVDYQVWVDGTLASTYPVEAEGTVEVVPATPGELVEVWDEWNLLDSLTVPACEQTPPVVEPPVVEPPVTEPPSQEVAVLGTKLPAPAAAAPATQAPRTAVLGTKSAAPQLAMTGPKENVALAGALLLVIGAALVRASRRV